MKANILLLLVDCLRSDAVLGRQRHTITPTFDRLARGDCCFSHLISVNSYTVPCMASLFTGRYPPVHGLRHQRSGRLPAEIPTLASLLAQEGYHTAAEASGPVGEECGFGKGFREFTWRDGVTDHLGSRWGERFLERLRPGGHPAPWFVYCHLWELHTPRQVSAPYRSRRYGRDLYERAISSFDARLGRILDVVGDDTIVVVTADHGEIGEAEAPGGRLMSLVKYRHLVKRLLPERLGNRLTEAATRLKNRVAFSRRASPEIEGTVRRILPPGHGAHVVDPLIRVPLFITGPSELPRGRVFDRVASQVDLAPTILDLAGVPAGLPGADGMSLVPFTRGQEMAPREVFFENAGSNAGLRPNERLRAPWIMGLRSDRYKFWYRRFNPEPYPELYDLTSDQAERNNLSASMPDRVAAMRRTVERLTPRDVDGPFIAAEELGPEETKLIEDRLRGLGYLS